MNHLKENAKKICAYLNEKAENPDFKYCVINSVDEIVKIYDTYTGPAEFLYIPSREEIEETVSSDDGVYLGYTYKGKLVGIAKLAKLELPSAFFIPPASEPKGDYYGCSGLLVRSEARGHHIAQKLVSLASNTAKYNGGVGIYADFDYRNSASMHVISKLFNFVGFADGRHGAEGEQTIYTTFYLPLTHSVRRDKGVKIACTDMNSVKNKLLRVMEISGDYKTQQVPYGGPGRYNLLYCLDNVANFDKFEIVREAERKTN